MIVYVFVGCGMWEGGLRHFTAAAQSRHCGQGQRR